MWLTVKTCAEVMYIDGWMGCKIKNKQCVTVKWYRKCFIYRTADVILAAPNVSGFIAQLVKESHRYREFTSSNPVKVLTFSGFHKCSYTKCLHNREDQSSLDFTSAGLYMKHFVYHFTFIPHGVVFRTHKWPAVRFHVVLLHSCRLLKEKSSSMPPILLFMTYLKIAVIFKVIHINADLETLSEWFSRTSPQ